MSSQHYLPPMDSSQVVEASQDDQEKWKIFRGKVQSQEYLPLF